jgi:hypothetical protein
VATALERIEFNLAGWAWSHGIGTSIALGVSALVVGIPVGYLARLTYVDTLKKRIRRVLVEHHDERQSFRCELELRADGVWVREQHVEILNSWRNFVAADDVTDASS